MICDRSIRTANRASRSSSVLPILHLALCPYPQCVTGWVVDEVQCQLLLAITRLAY